MTIKAVLFDVGGVFYIPNHEVLRPLLAEHAVDAPDDDAFHRAHYEGIRYHPDEIDDGDFWTGYNARYVDALGVVPDARERLATAIREVWLSGLELWTWRQEHNIRALARIADLVRVGIVSNADGTVEQQLREHGVCQVGPGEGVEVEVVIDSTVVGVAKPNPKIFDHALEPMGLRPDEVLYIGDTYRYDIVGANRAGMTAVHLDPYDLHFDYGHQRVRTLDELADWLSR
jgi:putative hydrolase of the HAD superfamily